MFRFVLLAITFASLAISAPTTLTTRGTLAQTGTAYSTQDSASQVGALLGPDGCGSFNDVAYWVQIQVGWKCKFYRNMGCDSLIGGDAGLVGGTEAGPYFRQALAEGAQSTICWMQ